MRRQSCFSKLNESNSKFLQSSIQTDTNIVCYNIDNSNSDSLENTDESIDDSFIDCSNSAFGDVLNAQVGIKNLHF